MLRLVLTLSILTSPAWACSCAGNSTPCSALKGTPTVFLGRVVRDTGAGDWGTRTAHMEVLEVFHGVPKGVTEVEVDSMAGTSCYMPLESGKTYVIFGGQQKGSAVIQNYPCTGSFEADGQNGMLEALREAERGGKSYLVGHVSMAKGRYESEPAGPGIRVLAEQQDKVLSGVTSSTGEFQFAGIGTGKWSVRLDSPSLIGEAGWTGSEATIMPSSCALTSLRAYPDGQIQGVVRDLSGKPIAGVAVDAYPQEREEFASSFFRRAITDSNGLYTMHGLPANRYLVGINGDTYEDISPYPPVFYPAAGSQAVASPIDLSLLETRKGIDFALSVPRVSATVIVERVHEDGTSIDDGSVSARDSSGTQRAFKLAPSDGPKGPLLLELWAGETYTLGASLYQFVDRASQHFEGTLGDFKPVAGENRVRIVLHRKVGR